MRLNVEKQEDGSFDVLAVSTQGTPRRVIGKLYHVSDSEALFAWKTRNDGLQQKLDAVTALLRVELFESPTDRWQQGFNAGLFRVADALGMTDRDDGAKALSILGQARTLIRDGLWSPGDHHKQWHLERLASVLGIDLEELDHEMARCGNAEREPGIAP